MSIDHEVTGTRWSFQLSGTSQNASGLRSVVQSPYSYELRGVDGHTVGGLRPFPGFMVVHEFRREGWGEHHDGTSRIVDLFPFTITVGTDQYAYGFVYRVRRKAGSQVCDVFADWWLSATGRWTLSVPVLTEVPGPEEAGMAVVPWGRLLYVFVRGQRPALLYLARSDPWTHTVVNETGPGREPELLSPERSVALGSITSLPPGVPAKGQVFLTEYTPEETGIYGVGSSYNPPAKLSDIRLSPGSYAFAYQLLSRETGRQSAISNVVESRRADFDPDVSGPRAPVFLRAAIEICWNSSLYDTALIWRSVKVQDAGGTYVAGILHLESVIVLDEWRTVNNLTPPLKQAVYWVSRPDTELAFQLIHGEKTSYRAVMPRAGAAAMLESVMVVSDVAGDPGEGSTNPDREDSIAGVGEIRWSSTSAMSPELFPPVNRYYPTVPTDTPIVLARTGEYLVGMSRTRVYHMRRSRTGFRTVEVHTGYGIVNYRALAEVSGLVYYLNERGLKSIDQTGALEDVRVMDRIVKDDWNGTLANVSMAMDSSSLCVWILNPDRGEAGILWFGTSVFTTLTDLPFSVVARGVWPEGFVFNRESLEEDPPPNETYRGKLKGVAFFVQNPVLDSHSEEVPGSPHRLLIADTGRVRVQTQGMFAGKPRRTLLPFEGDSIFDVAQDLANGGSVVELVTAGKVLSDDIWGVMLVVLDARDRSLVGRRAMVRNRESPTSVRVLQAHRDRLQGLKAGDVVGLSPVPFRWQGRVLGTADPYMVGPQAEQMESDFFRVRHVNAMGCTFGSVTNERAGQAPAVFQALLWRNEDPEPFSVGWTVGRDGSLKDSLVAGESTTWAAFDGAETDVAPGTGRHGARGSFLTPGVRIEYPDADWVLTAVMSRGYVMGWLRSRREGGDGP